MKIAVVGAGIFGVTIALGLDAIGHEVELHEKQEDILSSASRVNQYRLHMGYHYPRSLETIRDCFNGLKSFEVIYGGAIFKDVEEVYCLAKRDSKITPNDYLNTLNNEGLKYEVEKNLKHINYNNISLSIRVPEKSFNYFILKGICLEKLNRSKIKLFLNSRFEYSMINGFDRVIAITYRDNNAFCHVSKQKVYQYELVEKLLLYVPDIPSNVGTTVLDGEFCCLDPFPGVRGLFLMGHVDLAIHSKNIGSWYFTPTMHQDVFGYQRLLDREVIPAKDLHENSKAPVMIEAGREFFNYINPVHIGSMFTYRVVLPGVDETDERLSLVERVDEKVITVLGGKIPTVVDTAKKVVKLCQ